MCIQTNPLISFLTYFIPSSILYSYNEAERKQTDESQPPLTYGNKHQGLKKLVSLIAESQLEDIVIPEFIGLSHEAVFEFIQSHDKTIFEKWDSLTKKFEENPVLDRDCERILADTQERILNLFKGENTFQSLNPWLSQVKKKNALLMVRSSSVEDGDNCVNAGGNLSLSYVNPAAIMPAIGKVVASYFSLESLKNRQDACQNPFNELKLSVLLQEIVGEDPLTYTCIVSHVYK